MPLVVAFEDVEGKTIDRGNRKRIAFLDPPKDEPGQPMAILTKESPGRAVGTHFHIVDQWQVITEGKCKLGREEAIPYYIHFNRAYTPYGPLISDPEIGSANLSMFTTYQPGAQYVAEKREMLNSIPDRRPWQLKRAVTFPSQEGRSITGTELKAVPGAEDDRGLFAYTLAMGPNTKSVAPDASKGGGQYIVIVSGSVLHDAKENKAMTCIFVKPTEKTFALEAGSRGLEALVLNFPRSTVATQQNTDEETATRFKKWRCQLCAFIYDEAEGMPEDGIPPGTKWEDVPDNWVCPDCAAAKVDFDMVEVP